MLFNKTADVTQLAFKLQRISFMLIDDLPTVPMAKVGELQRNVVVLNLTETLAANVRFSSKSG